MGPQSFAVVISVLTLLAAPFTARASDDQSADALYNKQIYGLRHAHSCTAAEAHFSKIWSASTRDVELSYAVIGRCEQDFINRLDLVERHSYRVQMNRCVYSYNGVEGTFFVGETASCQSAIAARFSQNIRSALDFRRASFDCIKSHTVLEHLICSNEKLGQADIILSENYKAALAYKSDSKLNERVDRGALIRSERRWLSSLPKTCSIGRAPPDGTVTACVTHAFEHRFQAIEGCDASSTTDYAECIRGIDSPDEE